MRLERNRCVAHYALERRNERFEKRNERFEGAVGVVARILNYELDM